MFKDHHVPVSECPACGRKNDGALGTTSDDKPKAGDISICVTCHAVHIYNEDLSLREPSEEDILELPLDDISRAQRELRELKEKGFT